jgi:ribosomal protein RSM22 (predicted rRNA methylase)
MQLPNDLQTAIERVAGTQAGIRERKTAEAMSARYRDKKRHRDELLVASPEAAAAYAATRMPATWAAICSAMEQVAALCPSWAPETLLDVGAGTGAAAWAAAEVWPSLRAAELAERADAMIRMGQALTASASHPAVARARWIQADLTTGLPTGTHDLVTAAYMLNELGDGGLEMALHTLWHATGRMLLLVEPGTPDAWARMMRIRDRLLAMGAHLAGPCPHAAPCPVQPPDWCHFSQRVNRLRVHRQLKEAQLGYEDEKFTWLAFSRQPVIPADARVLRHPEVHAGWIRFPLCTPNGLETRTVTRKDPQAWRAARNLAMGDAWAETPPGDGADV